MYSGEFPVFKEEDSFEVLIPLTTPKTTPKKREITRTEIINLLQEKPTISKKEIAEKLNLSEGGVRYHIRVLKQDKRIEYKGSSRKGKWIVL